VEEITKHLGDIGTFGIFALAVIWMVLRYVVPAVRNGKKEEPPPPPALPANIQPADTNTQMTAMVAHMAACVEMLRDLHRWQQKEPVECAMKSICEEIRETRVTLCDKQNETNKSVQSLREKVIEWAARSRKSTGS